MATGEELRCHDCLWEFAPVERRFVVLKKMRDMPPDVDPAEARYLEGMLYDQVAVCDDCATWYGDDSMEVGSCR